ncbi:MAG: nucleoside hydrolase [Deltaproteobacteria bacterium]|nr:nucleoside hydrolase [Deltaproteobacteria bacterium]
MFKFFMRIQFIKFPGKQAGLFVILFFFLVPCFAHSHTYKISVIVDTDAALDDIRAVIMLINSGMADIPLIVTSDGAASPMAGAVNLRRLLDQFEINNTKIAAGRILGKSAPQWRTLSEDICLPEKTRRSVLNTVPANGAHQIVKRLKAGNSNVVYLCLGPLTNLADALLIEPEIKSRISRIIYFGASPESPYPGWNTTRDMNSANVVFNSGLPIYCFGLQNKKLPHFDSSLYKQIGSLNTPASRLVTSIHKTAAAQKLLAENHFYVWDELAVIFMNRPPLFKFTPVKFTPEEENSLIMYLSSYDRKGVHTTYLKLLGFAADSHIPSRHPVLLKEIPTDPSFFREDIQPFVKKIIEKHGLEEWKAALLTNEFHRHLGIYSIIGAKMGIRAREILHAPMDGIHVVSKAGTRPPLSCMNDGLQVASGASLGRGAIRVSGGAISPAAGFSYQGRKLTLKIKKEVSEMIKKDIDSAVLEFGGVNREYFAHIRKLSIDYWLELNRKKIFEEILVTSQ